MLEDVFDKPLLTIQQRKRKAKKKKFKRQPKPKPRINTILNTKPKLIRIPQGICKVCSKCNLSLDLSLFDIRKTKTLNNKNLYYTMCYKCRYLGDKIYHDKRKVNDESRRIREFVTTATTK